MSYVSGPSTVVLSFASSLAGLQDLGDHLPIFPKSRRALTSVAYGSNPVPTSFLGTSSTHNGLIASAAFKYQVTGTTKTASHQTTLLVLFLARKSRITSTEVLSYLVQHTPPEPSQESRKVSSTIAHP